MVNHHKQSFLNQINIVENLLTSNLSYAIQSHHIGNRPTIKKRTIDALIWQKCRPAENKPKLKKPLSSPQNTHRTNIYLSHFLMNMIVISEEAIVNNLP